MGEIEEYFWPGDDRADWKSVGVSFGVGGLGTLLGSNKPWAYACAKVDQFILAGEGLEGPVCDSAVPARDSDRPIKYDFGSPEVERTSIASANPSSIVMALVQRSPTGFGRKCSSACGGMRGGRSGLVS